MSTNLITIKDLSKTYDNGFKALKKVNLNIKKGEIIALLGPNGAGKTTLISIICGIVTPSSGKVSVDDFDIIDDWVTKTKNFEFLAKDPECRSPTSVCINIVNPWFLSLSSVNQKAVVTDICSVLESLHVAYDIASYRDAPPGFRIWAGPTIEMSDLQRLCPWLEWGVRQMELEHGEGAKKNNG
mgnify:CR=1 FL=1